MSVAHRFIPDDDVLVALRQQPKRLPCRLLYDAAGAELFERITQLADYYPTRCELRVLDQALPAIAKDAGPHVRVIEPGSGSGIKTRRLLRALEEPAGYIAVDVSEQQLARTAAILADEHPELDVQTVAADFTRPFVVPAPRSRVERVLVFFPGSTIGNFEPHEAVQFLSRLRTLAGTRGMLLLGADHTRDRTALLRAYDDPDGVTAEFDRNVLVHLDRTHHADFDPELFAHRAVWNELRSRVEMHLVSTCRQRIRIGEDVVELEMGEPIITEYSYKHSPHAMRALLGTAGWRIHAVHESPHHEVRLWSCIPG
jgi:dimethylhistidine N-methyltransferase